MAVASHTASFETFFKALKDYTSLTLLSDYDGTLAPFVVDRDKACPYAEVPEALLNLAANGVRVVIVSGRPARQVRKLLGVNSLEVWGSHGAERLLSTGDEVCSNLPQAQNFELFIEALEREGLRDLLEVKPFGVAVHWRGLPVDQIPEVRFAAMRAFQSNFIPGMKPFDFDGGIEFRPGAVTKADAVRRIKEEQPSVPLVYMGDDLTDEDAFGALHETDLSILVRTEYRETAAKVWLKPPDEVLSMLQFLCVAAGGSR